MFSLFFVIHGDSLCLPTYRVQSLKILGGQYDEEENVTNNVINEFKFTIPRASQTSQIYEGLIEINIKVRNSGRGEVLEQRCEEL